jgi:hypothetical protein
MLLPPKGHRVLSTGNACLRALCCTVLPFRLVLWCLVMLVFMPLGLLLQLVRASLRRCTAGKPSNIPHKVIKPVPDSGGYYAYRLVFTKPIDVGRLKPIVVALAKECNVDEKHVSVEDCSADYADGANTAPCFGAMEANHYTGQEWLPTAAKVAATHVVAVKVFNAPDGKATVLMGKGNATNWDGSSNFNFAREYLRRYQGLPHSDVGKQGQLAMSEASRQVYDNESFCRFLCVQLPVATVLQFSDWAWALSRVGPPCGGHGMDFDAVGRTCVLNLDAADSKAFKDGAAAQGIKPYAALTWAAVDAHNQVVGAPVRKIAMQASLQTRSYEPACPERNLVGDWLVGPLQRIDAAYSPATAQKEYASLIKQLNAPYSGSEVSKSFMAKAYGGTIAGASMFEPWATYPYDAGLLGGSVPTLFFNNYGLRDVPAELGCVSWNWCAPFYFGVNTMCINGQTCTSVSSSSLPADVTHRIRDVFEENLRGFIAAAERGAGTKKHN